MKKLFSLFAAVFCACTMFAVEVTFDFATDAGLTAMGITKAAASAGTNISTITYNGVVFTADKGSAGTNPRVWTGTSGATDFRIYSGGTLTIAGANSTDVITKIEMSGSKLYFTELTNGQWTGSANSVTFTPTATCNVYVIIVTMNEEAVVYVPDTISVSDAKALIDANDPKMYKGHYVKGVVAGDPFMLNNVGPAFYMTDIENPMDSLEGFKIAKDANNTAFADLAEMEALLGAGDTVMIYANGLALYNNKIYETTSGYFVEMLGKSDAIILNWSNDQGSAFREEGTWELEIKKVVSSNNDKLNLIFSSDKENAIAGFHALNEGSSMKLDGANLPITSGSVQLIFKEVDINGYNVYAMKVVMVANDQMYRLNQDVEFFASKDGDEIVLVGDRPFVPTEGQEITCAQAKEYALTLESGETSNLNVFVTGFVTDLYSDGQSFWMDDQQGSGKVLQAYKFSTLAPAGYRLKNGAKVKVVGKVTNYNGTAEIKSGAVEILEGGEEIPVHEVSATDALAACSALDDNAMSTDLYRITGFITSVVEAYSEQYKNISFWMDDTADQTARTFLAYRMSCEDSISNRLVVGAQVVVTAYIQNYYKAATDTTQQIHLFQAVRGSVELVQEYTPEPEPVIPDPVTSGTCGDNLTWNYEDTVLTISGTGSMWDYSYSGENLAPWYNLAIKSVVIGEGVTSIGEYAFNNCRWLTTVELPNSVTSIGDWAFDECSSLTSIDIPSSVTSIGNYAFDWCRSLTSVTIGNSVTSIGEGAFDGCSSLISVSAPAGIFEIEEHEWAYFSHSLQAVTLISGELTYNVLGALARSYRTLTSLDVSGVSNTELDDEAFKGCYNLQTLSLPAGLKEIKYMAVAGCKNLQAITIPAPVEVIEQSAFEDCRSLASVTFAGADLTTIGSWAFYNCHALTSIDIPAGVTEIGAGAFYGCTYLNDVIVPASVQAIGDNAFALCSLMQEMRVRAVVPPTIAGKTFELVSRQMPVYVPTASVNAYQSDPLWGQMNIIGLDEDISAVDNTTLNTTALKTVINGELLLTLPDGSIYNAAGVKVK